jgi:2-oxoglutarate ferredoxin oxidoreductase subunit alpha
MAKTAKHRTDIQIAICGSAGDGTIAAGDILKQAMARAGYNVIAFDVYPPEIRGFGKCIARARITSEQVYSLKSESDCLISLDDSHAIPHVSEVRGFGSVIYEDTPMANLAEGAHISSHLASAHLPYSVSFREISERITSSARSRNIVAVGYLAGLYDMPVDVFHQVINDKFSGKSKELTDTVRAAFDAGFQTGSDAFRLHFDRIGASRGGGRQSSLIMMSGNAAAVRGCLDAGIDAFFGYPITPATTIMEMLAREMPKRGARLLQTEDEISAIAATIGAGYAGARAATATSGPGLALMTEMMGLGAMAEVPAVAFVSQRGGPSTGMPTKTEQSDLNLAVFGVAGDGQRIVLAPTNVEGCYKCAGKAFEMAEKYQTPVIVLLDLYLSNRYEAVQLPAKNPFAADCSKTPRTNASQDGYSRFKLSRDGISPRAIPGQADRMHTVTGLEHDERGRPSDQPGIHQAMSSKRHDKLLPALKYPGITISKRFGDKGKVDVGVLGWGSTFGEILEAMIEARKEGIRCSAMKVVMLSPLPVGPIIAFMDDCGEVLVPELNYEAQFAGLVTGATGRPVHRLNRVTGAPMSVGDILDQIRNLANHGGMLAAE